MTRNEILEKTILDCKSEGITSKRAIARLLFNKYPDLFNSEETARSLVRRRTGACGNEGITFSEINEKFSTKKDDEYDIAKRRETKFSQCYTVTSAMNNTPVDKEFWLNYLAYSDFRNAEKHVIAMRYKNPTSVFSDAKDEYWCAEVLPYLDANRHDIHKYVSILSDFKIQPTVENPLSGLEGISADKTCIFGHPRMQFVTLPVIKGSRTKMMFTSGACTQSNYTDSKIGKKGGFHHVSGFNIISVIDEENVDVHYVTANSDGSFIDYPYMVRNQQVTLVDRVIALDLGDIHTAKLTQESLGRILSRIMQYRPEQVILHDVFDGESINPHDIHNPILKFNNLGKTLKDEIEECINFIKLIKSLVNDVIVVSSNHDRFLDRYIADMDWKRDIVNARTYTELALLALNKTNTKTLIANIINQRIPEVICLDLDESYKIDDIEIGVHGDLGANGSRGGISQFRRLSTKIITGHGHSPFRIDGCLSVGCQDKDHEYNKGLSSWAIGDVIINIDGKTQHVF